MSVGGRSPRAVASTSRGLALFAQASYGRAHSRLSFLEPALVDAARRLQMKVFREKPKSDRLRSGFSSADCWCLVNPSRAVAEESGSLAVKARYSVIPLQAGLPHTRHSRILSLQAAFVPRA